MSPYVASGFKEVWCPVVCFLYRAQALGLQAWALEAPPQAPPVRPPAPHTKQEQQQH